MKKRRDRFRGISLLEMLLVLALMGIVGHLSLSGWQRQQQMLQLEETSQQLLYFLHQAESMARWHNETLHLLLQRAEGLPWQLSLQYGPLQRDSPHWQDEPQPLPRFTPPWSDIALLPESASEQIQFFGRRGGAKGGHFTLSNAAGQIQVIVSARGRIRRCSLAGGLSGVVPC